MDTIAIGLWKSLTKSLRDRERRLAVKYHALMLVDTYHRGGRILRCECCRTASLDFLTIDHRENDGKEDVDENGVRYTGQRLYRKILSMIGGTDSSDLIRYRHATCVTLLRWIRLNDPELGAAMLDAGKTVRWEARHPDRTVYDKRWWDIKEARGLSGHESAEKRLAADAEWFFARSERLRAKREAA